MEIISVVVFVLCYIGIWLFANFRKSVRLVINNSTVEVKFGDLFTEEADLKASAFNEYFDTLVNEQIIASRTLNGMFINRFYCGKIEELNSIIELDSHLRSKIILHVPQRSPGKSIKYAIGTVCLVDKYLLTALSHFDKDNRAWIDIYEYISFLLSFWNEVDRVYAGKTVAIPVFGSGITRFKDYNMVSDQELLELIIWSFKVSRIKFTYPSRVKIIVFDQKKNKINLQALRLQN